MKRREFLTGTLAAGGLLLLPGCASFSGRPNDRINVAAIGCGRMGHTNIKGLMGIAGELNAQMVAVCDVDHWRASDTAAMIEGRYREEGYDHQVRIYHDYNKLLADRSVDAVLISVPDHSHAKIAIAAARKGKDIYLEKPLTFTIEEGNQLVEAVRQNRVILQTGTQQRSSLYFRKVCELARNGLIGELQRIIVHLPVDSGYGNPEPMAVPDNLDYPAWLGDAPFAPYTLDRVHPQDDYSRPGWMQIEDTCHGMITNWGSHMLDIAQWGNGTELSGPTRVRATPTYEERGLWDVHTAIVSEIEYASGVQLSLRSTGPGEEEFPGVKFIGTTGWAHCQRGFFDASDRNLLRWEPGPGDIALPVSTNHKRDFLESIRSRKDPIAPVDVAHRSNSLCILNMISAKLEKELEWDPARQRFVGNEMANRMLSDMRLV